MFNEQQERGSEHSRNGTTLAGAFERRVSPLGPSVFMIKRKFFLPAEGATAALLLTTIFTAAVAAEPAHSTLIYGNGKEYKTSFYDAHLLGELPERGNGPILVFSGRSGRPCALPDCDPETTVYFQSTSDEPRESGRFLGYPGNYYASQSGKLVARVRMFIGHCIDAREGVVWFIENVEKPPRQRDSLLESQVSFEFVNEAHSDGRFGAVLSTAWPTQVDISVARAAVANHICKEIAPLPKIYRSAAEYKGPKIQD
jgi:hypothetical protein